VLEDPFSAPLRHPIAFANQIEDSQFNPQLQNLEDPFLEKKDWMI
jgi:hypothetical protein